MISIKSYLSRDTEAETAYRRIIDLFLQGIASHAVEGDKADYARFQSDIDQCAKGVSAQTSMSELMVLVGSALRAMEDYNRRTSVFIQRQNTELQYMVSMLTKTVITIGATSNHSVTKLQDIEKAIDRTRAIEDIQLLKLRLGECLEVLREEVLRQKKDGDSALANLKQEVESARERTDSFQLKQQRDSVTGLPGKAEADRAIEAAIASPAGKFLLVAVCSRVQALNARFGYQMGDLVLSAFAEHFSKNMSPRDRLYRWNGPVLVAVLERTERTERIRTEIRQFADLKLEKTIDVGQRSALIAISARWTLFQVAPPLDAFLRSVDAFTAADVPLN